MPPAEMQKLEKNINTYGLVDPIIINLKNNTIIGGHQRYDILISQDETQDLQLIKRGDNILDATSGSGSTLISALQLNRNCTGIEKDKEYIELTEQRIQNMK